MMFERWRSVKKNVFDATYFDGEKAGDKIPSLGIYIIM